MESPHWTLDVPISGAKVCVGLKEDTKLIFILRSEVPDSTDVPIRCRYGVRVSGRIVRDVAKIRHTRCVLPSCPPKVLDGVRSYSTLAILPPQKIITADRTALTKIAPLEPLISQRISTFQTDGACAQLVGEVLTTTEGEVSPVKSDVLRESTIHHLNLRSTPSTKGFLEAWIKTRSH